MSYETLLYEKEDGVGIVTLNRPERLNALSFKLREELMSVFGEMEKDDEVKVVILTGGQKAFSAGADIKERSKMQAPQPQIYFNQQKTHSFFCMIENFEKPVIAAISGVAVGGGCELALVCDLRIASETARFGVPEVKIGVIPAAGGTQRLPRMIGITKAKELLYTGDFIDADEAYRLNLVNKVVSVDALMDEAKNMAKKLVANPPLSVKFAKRAVNAGMQMDLASALDYEAHCAALLSVSEDRIEGFKAFTEKRKPQFKGK
ncbi:MAG: enoyl-CoA hydratase/isomerase family protein [Desulfobacterales bacterium]